MPSASVLSVVAGMAAALSMAAADPSFSRDIRPIIQRQCQGCHQPALKSSELDLTSFAGFSGGGKRGPAFRAGVPEESVVLKYLRGELQPRMPMGQPALPAEQIELFQAWIAAGAKDDTQAEERAGPTVYHQPPVVTALAFSPHGKTLAVSGYREVLLHELDSEVPPGRLPGLSERIHSLAFSKDGSLLMAAGGTPARFGEVQLWELAGRKLRQSVTLTSDTLFGVSLSPDGSRIAAGCADNTVRILDAGSGKELHKIGNHENWVLGTLFGVDGKRIVSVGRDRAAKLTDAETGAFLENINLLRGELSALARHPARDVVVIGGEDRIPYVYRMDRPKNMIIADDSTLIRKLERQEGAILAMAWSPDGRHIAVAGAAPEVTLYDAESGGRAAAFTGHSAGIYTVAFSPDSRRIATGGFDGHVRIYDTSSGGLIRTFVPVPIAPATSELRSSR